MCYFLLLESGKVISRTTVTAVTENQLEQQEVQDALSQFDKNVSAKIDGVNRLMLTGDWEETKHDLEQIYEDEDPHMLTYEESKENMPGKI